MHFKKVELIFLCYINRLNLQRSFIYLMKKIKKISLPNALNAPLYDMFNLDINIYGNKVNSKHISYE